MECTVTAPVNIALIKYWGKRDDRLILPTNDSLSITLKDLYSVTHIQLATNETTEDTMILNGVSVKLSSRAQNVLNRLRALRKELEFQDKNMPCISSHQLIIRTSNNFPTAAGLASSASGFSALVTALNNFYGLQLSPTECSMYARMGSGSACRSIFGGFVQWNAGERMDGSDSYAIPLQSSSHWPELRVLVLVLSDRKKHVGSTDAMSSTIQTSTLFPRRLEVARGHIETLKRAIELKDFDKLAEITMQDSNQFHALCQDTFPPIQYMNDDSHTIVRFVHLFHQVYSSQLRFPVAYTFDAGPNAVLITLDSILPDFLGAFLHFFPCRTSDFFHGETPSIQTPSSTFISELSEHFNVQSSGKVQYIIPTCLGDGPNLTTIVKSNE
jgi:diphosphomevalonate decarboxylase